MNQFLAPGKEFSLIETLFDSSHFSKNGQGLGDDAFLMHLGGETWAISTDSSIEGIHYRQDWATLEGALEKALLSNLSDINAMGGKTSFAFFNLGALKSWDQDQIQRLGATLKKLESLHGFRVVGGDSVTKNQESFFNFTVMGRILGKPLLRSQALPGQKIYISGSLGSSAAGLALLQSGFIPKENPAWDRFFQAHFQPNPPLGLGPLLGGFGKSIAAIDISDGLSSELHHLSIQSGCRMVVEWSKLVYDQDLIQLPGGEAWKNWVLHGGEEYQLLFTGSLTHEELASLQGAGGKDKVQEIGRVEIGQGVGILDLEGKETELKAKGWSH